MQKKSLSYKDAGVNIDEGNRFVKKIKEIVSVKKKQRNIGGIGGFGGLFDISALNIPNPVLVSSIDGVGTKLYIAQKLNRYDTVGIDIVCHCVNDIMVQGAKPLFFTDYIGCGQLDADILADVIKGIVKACEEADCELLGGETAEMPGMYKPGEYDLVGSITGIVDKSKIITGANIVEGDIIIALPSNGLHTNGYSLARKIVFDIMKFTLNEEMKGIKGTLGDALLIPHRSYASILFDIMDKFEIKGLAHITGGGLTENLPRIFPRGLGALIDLNKINVLDIFKYLKEWGNVDTHEMMKVFNMGVGMTVIVSKEESEKCLAECKKFYLESTFIGEIVKDSESKVSYKGNLN